MEDTVTEAVRQQYEAYSYPPPIEDAEQFLKQWGPLTCDPKFAGIQFLRAGLGKPCAYYAPVAAPPRRL
jgi:hypothetical protein